MYEAYLDVESVKFVHEKEQSLGNAKRNLFYFVFRYKRFYGMWTNISNILFSGQLSIISNWACRALSYENKFTLRLYV